MSQQMLSQDHNSHNSHFSSHIFRFEMNILDWHFTRLCKISFSLASGNCRRARTRTGKTNTALPLVISEIYKLSKPPRTQVHDPIPTITRRRRRRRSKHRSQQGWKGNSNTSGRSKYPVQPNRGRRQRLPHPRASPSQDATAAHGQVAAGGGGGGGERQPSSTPRPRRPHQRYAERRRRRRHHHHLSQSHPIHHHHHQEPINLHEKEEEEEGQATNPQGEEDPMVVVLVLAAPSELTRLVVVARLRLGLGVGHGNG